MVQHETPNDYVVATGETHSVREFLDIAFRHIGIDDWDEFVVIDPEFYRPAEVDYLLGIPAKAKRVLGWEPEISFKQLAERMVDSDVQGRDYNDPIYKEFRLKVLKRDNFTCQMCKKKGRQARLECSSHNEVVVSVFLEDMMLTMV